MGFFGRKERQAEEKDPYEFVTNQCWEIGKENELTDEEIKMQIERLRSLGLTLLDDHAIASLEPRQEYGPVQAMKTAHLLRNVIYPPVCVDEDEEPAPLDFEQAITSAKLWEQAESPPSDLLDYKEPASDIEQAKISASLYTDNPIPETQ